MLNARVHHTVKRQSSLAVRGIGWRMEICGLYSTVSASEHVKPLNLLLSTNLYEQTLKFCKLVSKFPIGNYIQSYLLGMEKVRRGKRLK